MFKNRGILFPMFFFIFVLQGCQTSSENSTQPPPYITSQEIIQAFENSGITMTKIELEGSLPNVHGQKPTIFQMGNNRDQLLISYVFSTLEERKKAASDLKDDAIEDFFKKNNYIYRKFYTKNTILLYTFNPTLARTSAFNQTYKDVYNTIFWKLMEGKVLVFKGEEADWQAEIQVHYYDDRIRGEDSSDGLQFDFDSFYMEVGTVWYKGSDAESMGDIEYELSASSGGVESGKRQLGADQVLRLGSGGSGVRQRQDDTYTLVLRWNGKQETITLKSVKEYTEPDPSIKEYPMHMF